MLRRWAVRLGIAMLALGSCGGTCAYRVASASSEHLAQRSAEARARYERDWPEARAAVLLAQDTEETLAPTGSGATQALSCALPWDFGSDTATAKAFADACPSAPTLDGNALKVLADLGDGGAMPDTLPPPPVWPSRVAGSARWACLDEAPWSTLPGDPWRRNVITWPALQPNQLRGLVRLHLAHAERSGSLNAAAMDTLQLARLLLHCEVVTAQLEGVGVLRTMNEWLAARGHEIQGLPTTAQLDRLASARWASSQLLHPWAPEAERDVLQPKLSRAARCAALLESTFWAAYQPVLEAELPEYYARMRDPALLDAWCSEPSVQRLWLATQEPPDDVWERLHEGLQLGGSAAWLMRGARVSSTVRQIVGGTILSVATVSPVRKAPPR